MAACLSSCGRIILSNLALCVHSGLAPDRALMILADDKFSAVPERVRRTALRMSENLRSGLSLGEAMDKSKEFSNELCRFMKQDYAGMITAESLEAFQEYYESGKGDMAGFWKNFVYPLVIILPLPFIIANIFYFVQPQFEAIFASLSIDGSYSLSQVFVKWFSGVFNSFYAFFRSWATIFLEMIGFGKEPFLSSFLNMLESFLGLFVMFLEMGVLLVALLPFLSLMPNPPRFLVRINHYMSFWVPPIKKIQKMRRAILFSRLSEALKKQDGPVYELENFLKKEFSLPDVLSSGGLDLRWHDARLAVDFGSHFQEFRVICRERIAHVQTVFSSFSEPVSVLLVAGVAACLVMSVFDYINMTLSFCLNF